VNGPEHYRAAEQLLTAVRRPAGDVLIGNVQPTIGLAAAQVHATLALAAATAYQAVHDYYGDDSDDARNWAEVTK